MNPTLRRIVRQASGALVAVGFSLALGGCAHKTLWFRENLTQQQFSQDNYACVQEANAAGKGGWSFGPLWWVLWQQSAAESGATKMYELCMRARGYEQQQVPDHQATAASTAADDAKASFRRDVETSDRLAPSPLPCTAGVIPSQRLYILAVAPWTDAAGLRPGDRITTIGSTPVSDVQEWARALVAVPAGGPLRVSADRGDRAIALSLPCHDGREGWMTKRRMLSAGAEGNWDGCISASLDFEQLVGFAPYALLNTRLRCLQAKVRAPGRPYLPDEANLLHRAMMALLEESQHEPGALDRNRGTILTNATVLRQNGFPTLADDLERVLAGSRATGTTVSSSGQNENRAQ